MPVAIEAPAFPESPNRLSRIAHTRGCAPGLIGKTAGVAIPNILEWAALAIVVSIKLDLLDATHAARSLAG